MKIPKLRFKEFSGEWETRNLEDITKEKISYGIVQAGAHIENGVPYIKSTNVGGKIELSELQRTSQEIHYKYRRSAVHPNDIVFSLRGNIGEVSIVPEEILEANLTQGTARISVNDTNDTLFIYFQLQTNFALNRIKECSKGSTFKEIPLNELRKINILVCVRSEQTKIANFLMAVDEKISQLTQKYDLLKQYKKGVMQQIFSQKLRFKDDDGRDFPEWEEKKLGDITHIKTGSKDLIDKVDDGPYPFYVRAQKIEKIDTYSYDGEAILIPGDGVNVGKVYHYINGKFDYHQRVYKVSNAKSAEIKYLYFYMNQYFDQHAMSFNSKASVDSLRLPIIQNFRIQLPSKLEQTKIANFLTAIDDKITQAQTQLEAVKQYKKGLLQQLFV